MKIFILILFVVLSFQITAQEKFNFNSSDGLEITADLYFKNPETSPLILLFHQEGWSRCEYKEIAPQLN
jgi:thioredoxin-related protein